MHDRDTLCGMGMSIVFRRPSMRRPTRMTNGDMSNERMRIEFCSEIFKFSLCAQTLNPAIA